MKNYFHTLSPHKPAQGVLYNRRTAGTMMLLCLVTYKFTK